jgi:hypothetical protein
MGFEHKIPIGTKFGRLEVISESFKMENKDGWENAVKVKCECGVIKSIFKERLTASKGTRSCGCLIRESINTTHKQTGTKTYITWIGLLGRCENKNNAKYKNYGGRGITVCERWHKFENFYKDMGEKPEGLQIDRIDVNKGYYKDNCRWVTRHQMLLRLLVALERIIYLPT